MLEESIELIVSLKKTVVLQSRVIANQNYTTESIRTNIEGIQVEQQYLSNQQAEL